MSPIQNGEMGSHEQEWVVELLDQVHKVDPPATLSSRIMTQIAEHEDARDRSLLKHTVGGQRMAKKFVWGVAVAAALLLIAFAVTGYPPVGKGIEGTIGAAKRYRAEQSKSEDVKTQDPELQACLQTDTFHKLMADKTARDAMKSKDVRQALADPAV